MALFGREALEEYAAAMEELAFRLLELIARSLDLRPDRLRGFFREQTTYMRVNRYPPCPRPDLALGIGRHKDSGALTILRQDDDVGGLDVRRPSTGEWVRVRRVRGSLVVNIGDIIQVLIRYKKNNLSSYSLPFAATGTDQGSRY